MGPRHRDKHWVGILKHNLHMIILSPLHEVFSLDKGVPLLEKVLEDSYIQQDLSIKCSAGKRFVLNFSLVPCLYSWRILYTKSGSLKKGCGGMVVGGVGGGLGEF